MNRAVWFVAVGGCAQFYPPTETASSSPNDRSCAARALIEDAEDGDDQILAHGGRGGYVYTYADEKGTQIAPGNDFGMSRGGAADSHFAIRIKGKLGTDNEAYAGVGFAMTEPKGPYDASSYDGVSFVARRSAGSTPYLRFKIPDANTDPDGKICTECYNDFGIPFQVTEEWTRYEVKFSELAQEADWGQPRPAAIDRSKIYEMQWQVAVPNADFDVWIDDVTFLCNGSD